MRLVDELDPDGQLREINEALILSSIRQHELTEQAQAAEAALRKSEERWRLALDSAEMGAWNIDLATDTLVSDERFRAIHGISASQAANESVLAAIHPSERSMIRDAMAAATRPVNPAPYAVEYRVIHPDGSTHWVYARGRANFENHPLGRSLVSIDGTVMDITDRKLGEQSLRQTEGRFRLMAEIMPLKIFAASPKGDLTYLNPQWMTFTGLPFDQMKGWGWTQIVHPDDLSENVRVWRDAVRTGEPYLFEQRILQANGDYSWHISRAMPMRNEDGLITMWIGSSTDVDDVKRGDEARRVALEDEVVVRTAELLSTNEQLQGFTYSVAHDLRQMIRGISSNASMLLVDAAEALDDENTQTLKRLVDSSRRLAKLVDDLLTYARIGREEPAKQTIDLTALAEEVVASLPERGNCPGSTTFDIASGLVAEGDPLLIRIVIENLLGNACKYSSKVENPVVEVGCVKEAFFVRDNGIGFDMRFYHKLFEPFERLHGDSMYFGTGVGLANVKRIVERHGGRVWAEGKPGEGATFFFRLS